VFGDEGRSGNFLLINLTQENPLFLRRYDIGVVSSVGASPRVSFSVFFQLLRAIYWLAKAGSVHYIPSHLQV
jgi:hypothetical protein